MIYKLTNPNLWLGFLIKSPEGIIFCEKRKTGTPFGKVGKGF
jgi:hypothetical protein